MKRWMIIGGLALALALSSCSKSEPTASTPTTSGANGNAPTTKAGGAPTTKAGGAPTATLNMNDCVGAASANLGIVGGKATDVEKLKKYNPPEEVVKAAELIASKGGIQIDSSQQDEVLAAATTLTDWLQAVCPDS